MQPGEFKFVKPDQMLICDPYSTRRTRISQSCEFRCLWRPLVCSVKSRPVVVGRHITIMKIIVGCRSYGLLLWRNNERNIIIYNIVIMKALKLDLEKDLEIGEGGRVVQRCCKREFPWSWINKVLSYLVLLYRRNFLLIIFHSRSPVPDMGTASWWQVTWD